MRLAVFISGTGSNLKALIDAEKENYFDSQIKLVVSNKDAKGLDYAREENIAYLISKDEGEILEKLRDKKIDLIVLAGYLPKVTKKIIDKYKIINIHPSLLPKYGGKGFYGMNVHKAVFENKEKISGVSVHYVNENLDDGDIILQRQVDISKCESAEEIAKKVLEVEHKSLKEVIKHLEELN
ncbi:phosphoribosylglycinamide formyltransferase [Anaerococcus marasmi]|uniref:phosphoribosylglycinamide formyltransferase n=1 Tax=Anaerococcus marasmi TaxID=2057797 RepID=UPI000CF97F91|nr:phosphoribosylglycinamide formyltransferase [Anaerococcus marasmi]